ncbi:MAG: T9SS type A sorting domain-containing protein [Flavobacteriales bacterium]|nr:T9SS type A sorting domain-containing protein [Flavobacteriales bacterium]
MKKKLLFIITILTTVILSNQYSLAQCRLTTDSIIAGDEMTRHSNYLYDGSNRIVKIEYIDSNSTMVGAYDTIYYNGSNQIIKLERYWVGNAIPSYIGISTYSGSLMTRYDAAGDNGNGPWTMSHDFFYNGSNQLTDMVLDNSSVSGQPEGMAASFRNIQWTGGNPTYIEIVGDLGAGMDTLELNATYDSKNNLERLMPFSEASDALNHYSTNNILEVTFINDEMMGNAGTLALHNEYTYTVANEVETLHQFPGVFEDRDRTTQYKYIDCVASVNSFDKEVSLKVYPNPASDFITIETVDKISEIKLFNQVGEEVLNTKELIIDVSDFPIGVYFLQVSTSKGVKSQRVIIK